MSEAKWEVNYDSRYIDVHEGQQWICRLPGHLHKEACLIAAARDLLAACEMALANLKDRNCEDGETGDALRAAIVKAKGAIE